MRNHSLVEESGPTNPVAVVSRDRLRKRTRFASAMVVLFLLGFLGLSAILQIGGAVIGAGEVTVESSIKTISHPTGGILVAALVREGEHVSRGQPLMRLDTAVLEVGSKSASIGFEQLRTRRSRLQAEQAGASSVVFPADLTRGPNQQAIQMQAQERRLFRLRQDERTGAALLLRERARQYEEQIHGLQAQIVAIDEQMTLIQPELEGLLRLYNRQLVTINRINEMARAAAQLKGSKAALQSNIAEVKARISETREQILNLATTQRSAAATELATVTMQLNEQQVRVASADEAYQRSVVRAPQSGAVGKIAFTTLGSAIPPNQPILSIVPDKDDLVIEARVRPQDRDQLHTGQHARVTFSGLDRQTTPDFSGRVIFVSPDLARDETSRSSYYRVRVRLSAAPSRSALKMKLQPGMPAEVFIQTGDRSVLSFLIKPLLDQIRYALREE